MARTRRRRDDHGQQEPQLLAQPLPRPVINDLIEVVGQRTPTHTNTRDPAQDLAADLMGGIRGDRLVGNGPNEAG
jgi:hypothetical protein